MGLGPQMLRWISALYAPHSAHVKVNSCLSSVFPILTGVSTPPPLLFAMVLEPLLRKIQANKNIRGVTVGSLEHKHSAYTDDVLFHVVVHWRSTVSLPNLMEEQAAYSQVSNFKLNYTKSEILPIMISPVMAAALKGAFPFAWASSSIRYLGIQLTSSLEALFTHNYTPLLKKLN